MGLQTLDHLEQGLAPVSASPSTSLPSLTSAWLWSLVFYTPSMAFPVASRLLVLFRDGAELGLPTALKGTTFGCIQDAAVFLQTLVIVRMILALRNTLQSDTSSTLRRSLANIVATVLLSLTFLWMTLACLVDLTLLLSFLPRLNRGFVLMYLQFSSQFTSSLHEVLTLRMVIGGLAYLATMVLWVRAVICEKVHLPCFSILFCQAAVTPATSPSSSSSKKKHGRRRSISEASSGSIFLWLVHLVATSLTIRTAFFALLVSVSALHATIALDGDGNDIYLMSNAMFSLEMEDFLRPPTRSHATIKINHSLSRASTVSGTSVSAHETPAHSTLSDGSNANATVANVTTATLVPEETAPVVQAMNPFYERTIGLNEVFEVDESGGDAYPFWRKTVEYTGEKRFQLKKSAESSRPPPNVLIINLESFRSREVGVLGGRAMKAQFNQTVTPFFDSVSTTGVLFTQHYTPCVQTSRTILSSLFGVLPSMKDASAVATYSQTKLRLYGLPKILKKALNYSTTFWSAVNLGWEDWRGFLRANGFDSLVDENSVLDHLTKNQREALTDDDAFSWGRHDTVSFDALENFLQAHHDNDAPDKKPLFMDVYTVSSHDPWTVPDSFTPSSNYSEFLTEENTKYVNALNYVDQCLERFITSLRSKGLLNNTIVFIEGDHGYGRNEHGNNPTIVSSFVYDEGTHIPLLILADDLLEDKDKGLVVDELTSQTDLLATITDLVGVKNFMQHGTGQSMVRKRRPEASERAVVLQNPFYGQTRGLRVGRDLKYVRYGSGKYEVFNMTSDPDEMTPVESGKLAKNGEGGVHIGNGMQNGTAEELRFMEQVVDIFQAMYETNGFRPARRRRVKTPAPQLQPVAETPAAVTVPEAETVSETPTVAPHMKEVMDVVHQAMHKASGDSTESHASP